MFKKFSLIQVLCILGIIGVFGLMTFGSIIVPMTTQDSVTFTVTDKERAVTGSGDTLSAKYLIFTDVETFENTDITYFWKFDSSDLYGKIKVGSTYTAEVYGWRIGFLSSYRNIVTMKEVE